MHDRSINPVELKQGPCFGPASRTTTLDDTGMATFQMDVPLIMPWDMEDVHAMDWDEKWWYSDHELQSMLKASLESGFPDYISKQFGAGDKDNAEIGKNGARSKSVTRFPAQKEGVAVDLWAEFHSKGQFLPYKTPGEKHRPEIDKIVLQAKLYLTTNIPELKSKHPYGNSVVTPILAHLLFGGDLSLDNHPRIKQAWHGQGSQSRFERESTAWAYIGDPRANEMDRAMYLTAEFVDYISEHTQDLQPIAESIYNARQLTRDILVSGPRYDLEKKQGELHDTYERLQAISGPNTPVLPDISRITDHCDNEIEDLLTNAQAMLEPLREEVPKGLATCIATQIQTT